MLDNTPNQPSKFRTKNWVERDDRSYGTFSTGSQIKFKTSMIRSSLCDYSGTYILVKGTIIYNNNNKKNYNKEVRCKNCAPLDCAKEIDVVLPMYNLVEYSDNYSKTSGSLWQYRRDEQYQ